MIDQFSQFTGLRAAETLFEPLQLHLETADLLEQLCLLGLPLLLLLGAGARSEHRWSSEGDRQDALRRCDRLSLAQLQMAPRANCLNCELPFTCGLLGQIVWRGPENRPQPKPLSCSARGLITETEGLEIKPLTGLPTTETGTLPEHAFSAIAIAPAGLEDHCPVLLDYTAVMCLVSIRQSAPQPDFRRTLCRD